MKKTEETYTAELDSDQAKRDTDEKSSTRLANELGDVMLRRLYDDPTSMTDFEKGVCFALQFNKVFDKLVDEQRWIWGQVARNMLTIHRTIDCYRDNKVLPEINMVPPKTALEHFWDAYACTPNLWFQDFIENLRERKTMFEKSLAHDLDYMIWRLDYYVHPEAWEACEMDLPKDPGSGKVQINESVIQHCLNDLEYFVYENAKDEDEENQD